MECFVISESLSGSETTGALKAEYIEGIKAQIRKSRYKLREITENDISDVKKYFAAEGKRPVVILVGFTVMWIGECVNFLQSESIHPIVLTSLESRHTKPVSIVSFDEGEAVFKLCRYFAENGIHKIAYFGYNPNSFSHGVQYTSFKNSKTLFNIQDIHPYFDCYSDYGNIEKCANVFFDYYSDYEAVICSSPDRAIKLLHDIKKRGIAPDALKVASVGWSSLNEMVSPSLTGYKFDAAACGRKAVKIYKLIVNNPEISSLKASISGTLLIGGSTDFMPFGNEYSVPYLGNKFTSVHPTYITSGDSEIDMINNIENLINRSDKIDREYINLLLAGADTSGFAEKHFISENTLNYRIKNMCKTLGVATRKDLYDMLTTWLA